MRSYNTYLKKVTKKDSSIKKGIALDSWLLELSFNIAKIRKKQGLSQEEFANKLGMSQSAVARLESGQNMKCSTLWKISDVLEINLEIFGANKKAEAQKVEFFCHSTIPGKEIVGVSTQSSIEYQTKPSSFLNNLNNLFEHALTY